MKCYQQGFLVLVTEDVKLSFFLSKVSPAIFPLTAKTLGDLTEWPCVLLLFFKYIYYLS